MLDARLERERAALKAVLASVLFSRTPRLSALLKYICERHFNGEENLIKEYNLATEVLGRPPEFDQARDAIVRVEAHRLRRKLAEYYHSEGAEQQLRITIRRGHYVPEFVSKETTGNERGVGDSGELPTEDIQVYSTVPANAGTAGTGHRSRWAWLVAGALSLVIVQLFALGIAWVTPLQKAWRFALAEIGHNAGGEIPVSGLAPPGSEVRVLCGYTERDYTDPYGRVWSRDRYFKGGTAGERLQQAFLRTNDSRLFQNTRSGNFSYDIPLKPGIYELTLFFAETELGTGPAESRGGEGRGGEGDRVFDAFLNGHTLLHSFDILSDADGPNIADRRVFKDVEPAPDGYLHLRFRGSAGKAQVSAIRIVPGLAHRLRPIRFVAQQLPFTDNAGNVWAADNYYMGGRHAYHRKSVAGAVDQGLFASERYGHFSYAIPVDVGSYTVNLYFAETFFGPDNPGAGGVGSRVFNLFCNGNTLLRNFDGLGEGADNRAIIRTFRGLRPNPAGKLMLTFEPVANYAHVYAIEVLNEGD